MIKGTIESAMGWAMPSVAMVVGVKAAQDSALSVEDIVSFALAHKWMPLAAGVIGLLVRLTKDDNRFPVNIDPKFRAWFALGLGVVSGILDAMVVGVPWTVAMVQGLSAAVAAIIGHQLLIESLRSGKEIPMPGLMKTPPTNPSVDDTPTPSEAPQSRKSGPMARLAGVMLVMLAMLVPSAPSGCTNARGLVVGDVSVAIADATCAVLVADFADADVVKYCQLEKYAAPIIEQILKGLVGSARAKNAKLRAAVVDVPAYTSTAPLGARK